MKKNCKISNKRDEYPWVSWVNIMTTAESLIAAAQVREPVRAKLSLSMKAVSDGCGWWGSCMRYSLT